MGAISDRTGRRLPLVGGLMALAGSTVLFAFAPRMSWLFAARLVQGAADAVTWVVGSRWSRISIARRSAGA